jgi:hypothetical protein
VEQAVIYQEADRSLLAAFINRLIGAPGKQVRLQIPETIDKVSNMAIVATNAEKEERNSAREDRGTSTKVFTVGGTRENTRDDKYGKPRGKFQWSGTRGAGSQFRAGQTQRSRRVDGAYSYLTIGLLRNPRMCGPQGGARSQGRRPIPIGTRHVEHMTFNVIIAG